MQRTSADGVTVLWTPARTPDPDLLTAELSFGTGIQDETAPTLGVTQVIAALVRSEAGDRPHDVVIDVEEERTSFAAHGTAEEITDFLRAVCRAVSALPLDRLGRTARLLGIHDPATRDHRGAEPLSARYGPHGNGLALQQDPGMYSWITADMVRAHAAARFTRGNAVLALDGPPPEGLTLPLPDGPRPRRTAPRPRPGVGGTWQHRPLDTVSLLFTSRAWEPAAVAAHLVLGRRVDRTTYGERGIADAAIEHWFLRDRSTLDRVLTLHPADGHAEEAAHVLWRSTLDLASGGPGQEELDEFTAGVREQLDAADGHWRSLNRAVDAEHFGVPYCDDATLLEAYAAVTPQDVRDFLQRVLPDAVLVVPHQTHPDLKTPRGTPLPNSDCWRLHAEHPPTQGTVFRMTPLRRATSRRDERGEYVLTPWGIVTRDGNQDEHDIRFDEIALVLPDGPGRVVLTGCGCDMHVYPHQVRHGERLVAALDAAVPAHLVRPTPDTP
ncbi:hypothetical protein ACFW6V_20000 [Streptomyces sp. NPDC058734]|uniref:hypothetical protein n=1 Tax=Streptomyces sp. NPDC058734 TaxID=3346615 RepID=UPI00368CDE1A